jgi:hypothetical protein
LYREEEGYTRKIEDVQFLLYQRGERKMILGKRDSSYDNRVVARSLEKKKNLELEEGRKAQQQKKAKQPPTNIDHYDNIVVMKIWRMITSLSSQDTGRRRTQFCLSCQKTS